MTTPRVVTRAADDEEMTSEEVARRKAETEVAAIRSERAARKEQLRRKRSDDEKWTELVRIIVDHGAHKGRGFVPLHVQNRIVRLAYGLSFARRKPMEELISEAKAEAAKVAP